MGLPFDALQQGGSFRRVRFLTITLCAKWTLGEKIEIAIYKYVESFDRGQPHTTIRQLGSFLPPSQDVDIVDALRRLCSRGFIRLDKHVNNVGIWAFDTFSSPTEFFYGPPHGPFRISMTPEGRQDFEKRAIQQPLVFISCGQWHGTSTKRISVRDSWMR